MEDVKKETTMEELTRRGWLRLGLLGCGVAAGFASGGAMSGKPMGVTIEAIADKTDLLAASAPAKRVRAFQANVGQGATVHFEHEGFLDGSIVNLGKRRRITLLVEDLPDEPMTPPLPTNLLR